MPRKRSSAGRRRSGSVQTNLYIQVEKVNRQLRRLERSGEYGSYASKKLLRMANEAKQIKYNRKARSKISIKRGFKFSLIEQRAVAKRFQEFLGSKLSKASEIKKVRAETRRKVKMKLQGLRDEVLTNKDIDEFYSLTHDEDFRYLADKIGDSDVYILLKETQKEGGSAEDLIEKLQQFMIFTNSSDAADKARRLLNKWT